MSNAITLFSSARRNGNTGTLIDFVADKSEMLVIDLDQFNISPFDYEHKNKDDDFLPLMEKVLNHQHIIFSSPVYWYSVTPAMKAFLDRISDLLIFPELLDMGRQLRGKTGHIVTTSVSNGLSPLFRGVFETTFNYLGMNNGAVLHVDCSKGLDLERNQQEIL
ncbi:MAG: multimeric flavodoxin WrbA, partial [Paraglaciecola sp.]